MQYIHVPKIDARYWAAIAMASVFGTNLGDYYAHESGFGVIGGVPILLAIFAMAYLIERLDKTVNQVWYWLAIIVIRTGATNIADFLSFRVRLNMIGLCVVLALVITLLAVRQASHERREEEVLAGAAEARGDIDLPATNGRYWLAMLAAGVLGTVLGDVCSRAMGGGAASIVLGAILGLLLFYGRGGLLQSLYYYWLAVAAARTAGTAIGDWLAESEQLNIGLTLSTIITGIVFVSILVLWKSRPQSQPAMA